MRIAVLDLGLPNSLVEEIFESEESFEHTLSHLCQTIACNHSGYVCRDVSHLELAIIIINISDLKALKNDPTEHDASQKALDAMIHFIESNDKKYDQGFIMLGD